MNTEREFRQISNNIPGITLLLFIDRYPDTAIPVFEF
jgi:hypothetical protein